MTDNDEAQRDVRRRRISLVRELRHRGLVVRQELLCRRTTVEEAEREHLVKDPRLDSEPVPFGRNNDEWMRVKGRLEEDDELWEFKSPPDTWANLCGRAGICLVQDGWIIDAVVTKMN